MNICTIRDNLIATITGKKLLLAEFEQHPTSLVAITTINFLKLNIGELNKILADVEQCILENTQ